MRRASTRSSRTRPPSRARCCSARRCGRLVAAVRAADSSPPPSCGTAPFGAACAPRRSAWCATARPCRPPRRAGGPGSATARSTTSSSPTACLELHAAGASMVLQGLQFSEPHLGRTANNLALDLGHAVQVNAYLSPAAAKGLELHFDYHDVFVLQLDGAKRWRVWEPLERTRHPVRSGPRRADADVRRAAVSRPWTSRCRPVTASTCRVASRTPPRRSTRRRRT